MKTDNLIDSWNKRVIADHKKVRAEILALRPDWDAAKLATLEKSFGSPNDPGLVDILHHLHQIATLTERFGGAS